MTFLAANHLGADLTKVGYEMALFDAGGAITQLVTLDFTGLTAGKSKVLQFELPAQSCDGIGRILINAATACEGDGIAPDACVATLVTTNKTAASFGSLGALRWSICPPIRLLMNSRSSPCSLPPTGWSRRVMIGLALASIWCWAVIFNRVAAFAEARRSIRAFEQAFAAGTGFDELSARFGGARLGSAPVFRAALAEWQQSRAARAEAPDGLRGRLEIALNLAIAEQGEKTRTAGSAFSPRLAPPRPLSGCSAPSGAS